MKVENKAEFNRIFLGGIVIGIIVLGVMIYLVIHIVKQNKKIAESKNPHEAVAAQCRECHAEQKSFPVQYES